MNKINYNIYTQLDIFKNISDNNVAKCIFDFIKYESDVFRVKLKIYRTINSYQLDVTIDRGADENLIKPKQNFFSKDYEHVIQKINTDIFDKKISGLTLEFLFNNHSELPNIYENIKNILNSVYGFILVIGVEKIIKNNIYDIVCSIPYEINVNNEFEIIVTSADEVSMAYELMFNESYY